MKIIEVTETEIYIKDGENVSSIKVDEGNPFYTQLRTETNNFTENLVEKNALDILEQNQTDLIYQLMLKGVL